MNIYLAGRMSGMPDYNFPVFAKYAQKLRDQGHFVFSPAEADLEDYGTVEKVREADDALKHKPNALWCERLEIDFRWILMTADAIALIPGWEESKGANAELALARAMELEVIYLDE